jgi:glycine/D-amino acid oxidase-like deaminating enzyme
MKPLSKKTQTTVAIVGGGLAGTSLAMAFAESGIQCTVFESHTVGGAGASAISRGIVRVFDYDPWLMQQAYLGVRTWKALAAQLPGVFTQCGALYLVSKSQREQVQRRLDELNELNYTYLLLRSAQAIVEQCPQLARRTFETDQWAIWEPEGGYVNTRLSCQLFAQHARAYGALVLEGVNIKEVEYTQTSVLVSTNEHTQSFDFAVLATGARLPELTQEHDVFCRSIPLSLVHSETNSAVPFCLIDETVSGYLRPEDHTYFFAGGAPQTDVTLPKELEKCAPEIARYNERIASKILAMDTLHTASNLLGYDGYRRDFLPNLEPVTTQNRIGRFTAFSGRGAKYIPAAAQAYVSNFLEAHSPANKEVYFA